MECIEETKNEGEPMTLDHPPCGAEVTRQPRAKICIHCKIATEKRQSHHLLSYKIARCLYVLQFGEPVLDSDYRVMEKVIKRARKNYGDIMLCPACHEIADDSCDKISSCLEKYMTSGEER
jgi:hypothetical protein